MYRLSQLEQNVKKDLGDVFRTNADISKIGKILGFKPKVSFEEGLKRTVAWFKK